MRFVGTLGGKVALPPVLMYTKSHVREEVLTEKKGKRYENHRRRRHGGAGI